MELISAAGPAFAQTDERVLGDIFRDRINGALSVLGLTMVPDIAASSLTITDDSIDRTNLFLWQFGDGFTISDEFPVFLEGYVGFARYDPTFIVSSGDQVRQLPSRWNSVSATVGVGYALQISESLSFRPTANFSFGHIESDLALAGRIVEEETGLDLSFLDAGRMNAAGYGGALVLDYQRWTEVDELDIEVRYTHMRLEPFSSTSAAFNFGTDAVTASIWGRYRWLADWQLLGQPMRYVVDLAHTTYFADSRDALGFNHLTRIGAGLEMEVGSFALFTDRLRVMGRLLFGENVRGYGVGLSLSF